MRSRIWIGLIAGGLGGFLGWLLQESMIRYDTLVMPGALPGQGPVEIGLSAAQFRILVFCVGGSIGLFLGAVDGIVEGNRRKLWRGMGIGVAAGIVLGYMGMFVGSRIYNALGGTTTTSGLSLFAYLRQIIARSFGWALMGLGLGVGSAIATLDKKRIWQGALGGFLGGFAGGAIFDILANFSHPIQEAAGRSGPIDVGGPSRMVGFTAIGGLTGLFIGIVEELFKQAWVKVLAGRNEGKDFILSKPLNILGRDERSDVPLYGDPGVGTQHAAIRADGKRHVLIDANTPTGTVVNGQRVPPGGELLLRDGDMIQIGAHRILFREKATASKIARPAVDMPKSKSASPAGAVPMPGHLCPFCGAPKDASGGCLCGVPGSPAGSAGAVPAAGAGSYRGVTPGVGAGISQGGAGVGAYSPGMQASGYGAPGFGAAGAVPRGGSEMPRIVGIEGPYTGEVFLLTGQNIGLGREPGRDIVLAADSTISRNHARIANEGGDLVVYDNGSVNGTFVNGMRISMQVLVPGDIVQFGSSKFRFE